jgi:hypothetical protein
VELIEGGTQRGRNPERVEQRGRHPERAEPTQLPERAGPREGGTQRELSDGVTLTENNVRAELREGGTQRERKTVRAEPRQNSLRVDLTENREGGAQRGRHSLSTE